MAGNNIGKHAQATSRREARKQLEEQQALIDETQLYDPDISNCVLDPSELFLDETNRLHTTYYWEHGKIVRFFFAWQYLERGIEWVERYSVCAQHGYLHEHTHGHQVPDDRVNIAPLYSQTDVQELHDDAYDMVHTRYQMISGGGLK